MPKLKRFSRKSDPNPLESITCPKEQKRIVNTVKAIEGYVMCSCIAIGLQQIISLKYSKELNETPFRFLRTKSRSIVSEATVACYLRRNLFSFISEFKGLSISQLIKAKQVDPIL